jgi:hypothetical protein
VMKNTRFKTDELAASPTMIVFSADDSGWAKVEAMLEIE